MQPRDSRTKSFRKLPTKIIREDKVAKYFTFLNNKENIHVYMGDLSIIKRNDAEKANINLYSLLKIFLMLNTKQHMLGYITFATLEDIRLGRVMRTDLSNLKPKIIDEEDLLLGKVNWEINPLSSRFPKQNLEKIDNKISIFEEKAAELERKGVDNNEVNNNEVGNLKNYPSMGKHDSIQPPSESQFDSVDFNKNIDTVIPPITETQFDEILENQNDDNENQTEEVVEGQFHNPRINYEEDLFIDDDEEEYIDSPEPDRERESKPKHEEQTEPRDSQVEQTYADDHSLIQRSESVLNYEISEQIATEKSEINNENNNENYNENNNMILEIESPVQKEKLFFFKKFTGLSKLKIPEEEVKTEIQNPFKEDIVLKQSTIINDNNTQKSAAFKNPSRGVKKQEEIKPQEAPPSFALLMNSITSVSTRSSNNSNTKSRNNRANLRNKKMLRINHIRIITI